MDLELREELAAVRRDLTSIMSSQKRIVSSQDAAQASLHKLSAALDICIDAYTSNPTEGEGANQLEHGNGKEIKNDLAPTPDRSVPLSMDTPKQTLEDRRKRRLQSVLEANERHHATMVSQQQHSTLARTNPIQWLRERSRDDVMNTIEGAMFFVIAANAIVLGLDADLEEHHDPGLFVVNLIFGILFWSEVLAKVMIQGFCEVYWGEYWLTNMFDAFLVIMDSLQLVVRAVIGRNAGVDASLFRLLKLFRLTRLLQFLRWEGFRDLLKMVQGVVVGMSTLVWACLLFLMLNYIAALLCQAVVRQSAVEGDKLVKQFNTLPQSMFTVFRCSLGDCSTSDGLPLIENVPEAYKTWFQVGWALYIFFIVFGLFNIISAIFVDSTVAYGVNLENSKLQARLADEDLFGVNCATVIAACLDFLGYDSSSHMKAQSIDLIRNVEIRRDSFREVVTDPKVREALDNLDIESNDHRLLDDILDPDHDGSIQMLDLVSGLRRLRGQPRRSDLVVVDLMLRSFQKSIQSLSETTRNIETKLGVLNQREPKINREDLKILTHLKGRHANV